MKACRDLLGKDEVIDDDQLIALRNSLYQLGGALLRVQTRMTKTNPLTHLAAADRIDVEERAAILEFDAGLTRDQAERLAMDEHLRSESPH